jgi:hypothetical protein
LMVPSPTPDPLINTSPEQQRRGVTPTVSTVLDCPPAAPYCPRLLGWLRRVVARLHATRVELEPLVDEFGHWRRPVRAVLAVASGLVTVVIVLVIGGVPALVSLGTTALTSLNALIRRPRAPSTRQTSSAFTTEPSGSCSSW